MRYVKIDTRATIVGLGELLWDRLPSGPQLGGAPTNFIYYTSLLGAEGIIATCVGEDRLGSLAIDKVAGFGLTTDWIQRDQIHPTGTVDITIGSNGEPYFNIEQNAARAFMSWTNEWQVLASRVDLVCFGTIARYQTYSANTINAFIDAMKPSALRIFDVNLRQKLYSPLLLEKLFQQSDVVKLNAQELLVVGNILNIEGKDLEAKAEGLLARYKLDIVCVTRGSEGSILLSPTETVIHNGVKVQVADTIGAGDAFTATLACGYLNHIPLQNISEGANQLSAWVASRPGATPVVDENILFDIRQNLYQY